jgi:hypothetical protein
MAEQSRTRDDRDHVFATVARLVTAADGDTLYRDVYLRRAAELLSPIVTETTYQASIKSREQLTKLLAQARTSVTRQDWEKVRELGTSAAAIQRSLDADQGSLSAAEAVYSAPPVALDPLSAGLTRMSKRWSDAAAARAEVSAALGELAREDAKTGQLYASRQRALGALDVPGATPSAGGPKESETPGAAVELQALQALERGDAAALEGLAASMISKKTAAQPAGGTAVAAARGRIAAPDALGEARPEGCLARASALGLERVEAPLVSQALASSIAEFMERYALGASPAVRDLASEGVARLTIAAEEAAVPPDAAAVFADTIAVFALHVYVNSAGIRYVPLPAPREVLLMETHAEEEEPVTPLLKELGLERRRALARDEIEASLLKHGARVVAERLGLDPLAFRLVCVPPDVFVRVGRERGWGKREQWTHFDGYQVLSGGRLRALVGGNARFGGVFDLCSISHDDARENTVVRFAVIRRERFGVRIG